MSGNDRVRYRDRTRTRVVVAIAIALALGISFFLAQPFSSRGSNYSTSGSNGASMAFGVVDESASYGIPSYKNAAVQQADLSMLASTGAQCVRLDIDYGPWLPGGNSSQTQLLN